METVGRSAATGIRPSVATTSPHVTSTSVQDVEIHRTVLRNAVSQRRRKPQTLLVADQWETDLHAALLHTRYPTIPVYI